MPNASRSNNDATPLDPNFASAEVLQGRNYKQKVDILESEIAQADDPETLRYLRMLLNKTIEEHERKGKKNFLALVIGLIILLTAAGYLFFRFFPDKIPNNAAPAISSTQSNDTTANSDNNMQNRQSSDQRTEDSSNISSTQQSSDADISNDITTSQFENWVAEVWNQKQLQKGYTVDLLNDPELTLETYTDAEGYAAARIASVQSDTLDAYRINAKGQLEENAFFIDGTEGWKVVANELPRDLQK